MELYALAGIIFLMIAALVVTRQPEEDSESSKAVRSSRGGADASRRPAESLSRQAARGKGAFGRAMQGHESA
jgi:hypothetical protein